MKKTFQIAEAVKEVQKAVQEWEIPYLSQAKVTRDPYRTLVGCMMSLRTKDETTHDAAERLFSVAATPWEMRQLSEDKIASLIYPVGFYRQKAVNIVALSKRMCEEYDGKVPKTIIELITFRGVGRKTANLVVTEAFHLPGICVDTHVHRISNRWGYVTTRTPDETERALREKLPKRYWMSINRVLVSYGKNRCTPQSPWCSVCTIEPMCAQAKVTRTR